MNVEAKMPGSDEAWDEKELGADIDFAELAETTDEEEQAIDAALELQPISIRLQKSLIEDFKLIASLHGLGYQPLMRQVLKRFADCEKKRILREVVAATQKQENDDNGSDTSTQKDVA